VPSARHALLRHSLARAAFLAMLLHGLQRLSAEWPDRCVMAHRSISTPTCRYSTASKSAASPRSTRSLAKRAR